MAKKSKYLTYETGDIFSFEIAEGEYASGRILLKIYEQCVGSGILKGPSYLDLGSKQVILVEIYGSVLKDENQFSDDIVLFPSCYITASSLMLGKWKIIGNRAVDPTKIDFPEFVSFGGSTASKFIKGEISQRIDLDGDKMEEMKLYSTYIPAMLLPEYVLFSLGKFDKIKLPPEDFRQRDMQFEDLRFSKYREEIYALLPDEFNQPYYELAKSRGFDLKRFYEL